jgi:formate dehydrogenase maturation protein FdhE
VLYSTVLTQNRHRTVATHAKSTHLHNHFAPRHSVASFKDTFRNRQSRLQQLAHFYRVNTETIPGDNMWILIAVMCTICTITLKLQYWQNNTEHKPITR